MSSNPTNALWRHSRLQVPAECFTGEDGGCAVAWKKEWQRLLWILNEAGCIQVVFAIGKRRAMNFKLLATLGNGEHISSLGQAIHDSNLLATKYVRLLVMYFVICLRTRTFRIVSSLPLNNKPNYFIKYWNFSFCGLFSPHSCEWRCYVNVACPKNSLFQYWYANFSVAFREAPHSAATDYRSRRLFGSPSRPSAITSTGLDHPPIACSIC